MAFPYRHLLTLLTPAAFGMLLAASGAESPPVPEKTDGIAAQAEPDPARQRLVRYLSRRFHITAESTGEMVDAAYRAARPAGLDPLLVLAVIAVESRFNPIAQSAAGAKGLMQITPEEEQGDEALLDPASNIRVGTGILQEYVDRTGTVEEGLQFYGVARDSRARYAQRVMAERDRLERVMRRPRRGA